MRERHKEAVDSRAPGGVHGGITTSRAPRQLTDKYEALLGERSAALARIEELDRELDYLNYSLKLLAPVWTPAAKVPRKLKASRLPRGAVARDCLHFLRTDGELWTSELVGRLTQRHHLKFASREDEEDFASAVAMAFRRYERQGSVTITERNAKTRALRWQLTGGLSHRLEFRRQRRRCVG